MGFLFWKNTVHTVIYICKKPFPDVFIKRYKINKFLP